MKQFLLAGLVFISAAALAQTSSDPAAKKILDAVSAKFKTFKAVQANFNLKIEDSKGKVQGQKKGTVYMKGTKYRVSVTGQEIFCDGNNTWTFDKAANEVTINKFDPTVNTLTPQKLFTNFYDQDFLYKLNGEKKEAGKTLQEIEMTPKDKSKPFFKVYILVDKATQFIYTTKWLDKSGNKYTYIINSLNGKAAIAESTFTFDKAKYPGVEVVDLR
ncbi:MAG: outer membrane lipoprotein carrier protein LolA [Sphingobacteriales bacterium]|jgi:outer membrane lipoprotein carrier protein|nr:MAG: outer membrane lipoprotein carrier protein LolA [Sphingobacteriales bacterium]